MELAAAKAVAEEMTARPADAACAPSSLFPADMDPGLADLLDGFESFSPRAKPFTAHVVRLDRTKLVFAPQAAAHFGVTKGPADLLYNPKTRQLAIVPGKGQWTLTGKAERELSISMVGARKRWGIEERGGYQARLDRGVIFVDLNDKAA
jgi:hypothetical protein